MKNLTRFFTILLSLLVITNCEVFSPNRTVRGSGPVESEIVDLDAFHEIQTLGIIDVNIVEGSSQEVVLSAQQEILDVLEVRVQQGRLIINFEDDTRIKTSKSVTADIVSPGVDRVIGTGTGDYHLEGSLQDELYIELEGTGHINAFDLPVRECTVVLTGTGDAKVNVQDHLYVDLTGTGDVYYQGTPSIDLEITGTGGLVSDG